MHRLTDAEADDAISLASVAAEIYGMRRARDQVISTALVGEPAWDILLALYSEHPSKLAVSSLSSSFGVPASTIVRWVDTLQSRGLIERPDPPGSEPTFVSLTQEGRRLMERCLETMLGVARE